MSWYFRACLSFLNPKHPSEQKQVHFRLRNRQSQLMMSLVGDLDDIKMMRIQEMEETGKLEQIWFYHNGYLRCQVTRTAVPLSLLNGI